jgi:hypothetical protein
MRLTDAQQTAVINLRRCAKLDDGWGVICVANGADGIFDGQAFVNWRTAFALERRGLAEIDGDLQRLRLTEAR